MSICYHVLKNKTYKDFIETTSIIPRLSKVKDNDFCYVEPKLLLKSHIYDKITILGNIRVLIFEQKAFINKGNIHVDLTKDKLPHHPVLNIVLEGQGGMRWYTPTNPGILKFTHNSWYRAWHNNYGQQLDEWNTGKVAIVRTDIPHLAFNEENSTRLVASIRWDKSYTFTDTIKFFEDNF